MPITLPRTYQSLLRALVAPLDQLHLQIVRLRSCNRGSVHKGLENAASGWMTETPFRLSSLNNENGELGARYHYLTKLCAAQSQFKQAMANCETEDELFRQICHDTVVFGGLKMAWIGLLDEHGKRIITKASYGEGTRYLEGHILTIDQSQPADSSLIGCALRENRACWAADISGGQTGNWDRRCVEYGRKLSCVLPLHREGVVIGILGLYSNEANTFDEASRHLLIGMALDIDFALHNLHRQRQHVEAERALAQSHTLLRTIIDTAPIRVFWKDRHLRFLGCNPAFARDAGELTPEDIIGKDDYQLCWKAQADLYRADDQQVIDSRVAKLFFEERQTTPDGQCIWLRTSKVPLRNQENEIIGILGIYEDITEQHRAEESARISIQRLNEAQRMAQIGNWELNLVSGMLFWSDEIYCIFEIDKSEFGASYQIFLNSIHPDDRDSVTQAYANSLENHSSYEITHRLLMPDGRIKWIQERGETVYDAQGNPLVSKGTAQDVTARKLAEDLLKRHNMVIDTARDGFWVTDTDGNFLEANQAYADMTGYSLKELESMRISDVEVIESASDTYAHLKKVAAQGSDLFETVHRRKDGTLFDVEVSVNYMADLKLYFAFFRDITSRKQAQTEISRLLSRQQAILDGANYSIIVTDTNGIITDFNAAAERMLGYRAEEIVGRLTPEIFHDRQEVRKHAEKLSEELGCPVAPCFDAFVAKAKLGIVEEYEWIYIRKDRSRFPVLLSVTAMHDQDRRIVGFMGIASDISERKKAQEDLHIAATTFETHEAIMITNSEGSIVRVNNAFEQITGYSKTEVINQNPRILNSGRHDKAFFSNFWQVLKKDGTWSGEIWDRHKSGRIYPKYLKVSAVKALEGKTTQYVAMFSDISERKKSEEEIYNLAFYDPLTGLPNRRLLYDRLSVALMASSRSKHYGALLYLDLDNFKKLNDTRGHEVGDKLLIEVGIRLKSIVREIDTVARIGGDEFLVLLENISIVEEDAMQNVAQVAEKIRASLSEGYQINEHSLYSSPSIGICLFRGYEISLNELIKHADIAMYHAKDAGKNKVRFFDPQLQLLMERRFALESDLRRAITEGQLELYYQIQLDSTLSPIGAEALIRWIHPERGKIGPSEFIAVAEESSLILDIGDWVLDKACQQIAKWSQNAQTESLVLAVNISAKQFMQADFIEQLALMVKKYQVNPSRLKLELTESIVLDDIDAVVVKMQALKHVLVLQL